MALLSIITINFNNKEGLRKTIESVVNQRFRDFEYIVIDGGSTDGSAELIQEYSHQIKYWISEKDKGIYNAMNKGIAVASGDYCLFLNSGDYFINNAILEKVCGEIHTEEIVYGKGRRETEVGKTVSVDVPDQLDLDYFSGNSLFHPGTFIKRSLFDTYGLYNESNKIVSDWEFFIKTIFINHVKARKIQFEIAVVEDNGISRSSVGGKILQEEIKRVLSHYFPTDVISLIQENKRLKLSGVPAKKTIPERFVSKMREIKQKWIKRK